MTKKNVLKISLIIIFLMLFINILFGCDDKDKNKTVTLTTDGNFNIRNAETDEIVSNRNLVNGYETLTFPVDTLLICNIKKPFLDKLQNESLFITNIIFKETDYEGSDYANKQELEKYPESYKFEFTITKDSSLKILFAKKEEFRTLTFKTTENINNYYLERGRVFPILYKLNGKEKFFYIDINPEKTEYITPLIPINSEVRILAPYFYQIDNEKINPEKIGTYDYYNLTLSDNKEITFIDEAFIKAYTNITLTDDSNMLSITPSKEKYLLGEDITIRVKDHNKCITKITINKEIRTYETENIQEITVKVTSDLDIVISNTDFKDFPNINNLKRDFYIIKNDTNKKEVYFFYKEFSKTLTKLKISGIENPLESVNNVFKLPYENLGIISYEINESDIINNPEGISIDKTIENLKTSDIQKYNDNELFIPFKEDTEKINIDDKKKEISFNNVGNIKVKKVTFEESKITFTNIAFNITYEIAIIDNTTNADSFYLNTPSDTNNLMLVNDAQNLYLPNFNAYFNNYKETRSISIIASEYRLQNDFEIFIRDIAQPGPLILDYKLNQASNAIVFSNSSSILEKDISLEVTYSKETIYKNTYHIKDSLFRISTEEDLADFLNSNKSSSATLTNNIFLTSPINASLLSCKTIYGNFNSIITHYRLKNVFEISSNYNKLSFINTSFKKYFNPYDKELQNVFTLNNTIIDLDNVIFENHNSILIGSNLVGNISNVIIENSNLTTATETLIKISYDTIINQEENKLTLENINISNNGDIGSIIFVDNKIKSSFTIDIKNINIKFDLFNILASEDLLSLPNSLPNHIKENFIKINGSTITGKALLCLEETPEAKELLTINITQDSALKTIAKRTDILYLINNNILSKEPSTILILDANTPIDETILSEIGEGKTYQTFSDFNNFYLQNMLNDVTILEITATSSNKRNFIVK